MAKDKYDSDEGADAVDNPTEEVDLKAQAIKKAALQAKLHSENADEGDEADDDSGKKGKRPPK